MPEHPQSRWRIGRGARLQELCRLVPQREIQRRVPTRPERRCSFGHRELIAGRLDVPGDRDPLLGGPGRGAEVAGHPDVSIASLLGVQLVVQHLPVERVREPDRRSVGVEKTDLDAELHMRRRGTEHHEVAERKFGSNDSSDAQAAASLGLEAGDPAHDGIIDRQRDPHLPPHPAIGGRGMSGVDPSLAQQADDGLGPQWVALRRTARDLAIRAAGLATHGARDDLEDVLLVQSAEIDPPDPSAPFEVGDEMGDGVRWREDPRRQVRGGGGAIAAVAPSPQPGR